MSESLHVAVKMYINYSFFTFINSSDDHWKLATYLVLSLTNSSLALTKTDLQRLAKDTSQT